MSSLWFFPTVKKKLKVKNPSFVLRFVDWNYTPPQNVCASMCRAVDPTLPTSESKEYTPNRLDIFENGWMEDSTTIFVQEVVLDNHNINENISPNKNTIKANSEQEEEDDELIRENQYVFIQMPSGNIKVVKLQKDTTVSLGKFGTFHSNDIIDRHFGHSYEIYEGDKVKVIKNIAYTKVDETDANNRDIMDDPSKQKLSYTDIENLKKEGMEGQEIIKKVVESHSSFEQKTEYSKAKYIKRKEAKFSRIFTPLRPTLYSVWEYFFRKNPGKIREMRIDTLSQILSLTNVHANIKILVVDDTQGLVISGVMERLGGHGTVLGIHDNENHNYDIVRYMNFSAKVNDSLRVLSWQQVLDKDDEDDEEISFDEIDETTLSENDRKGYLRRKAAHDKLKETKQLLLNGEFDGLIIASQYQPESILETLVQYVAGSRPIVIYHINKEVLPGRTHPEMSTTGGGGYILSTIRIIIDQSLPSPKPSYMKLNHSGSSSSSSNNLIGSSSFTNNINDNNEGAGKRPRLE
ncbi:12132_t:CDS:10 [Ambispora gerdemannii]|uniref:tRNA (adenine(58)-N(1))-methyltransferase non-catalytic subunit TRM6 n=1 Tax=Ambispora gerdemannii TaxID=144530 RepID=A0A9N8UWX8_9GLOM|nr:12132_t:CDS:10 [Ambispora gerdemannii]